MQANTQFASGGENSADRGLVSCVALGKSSLAVSPATISLEKRGTELIQLFVEFLERALPQVPRRPAAANHWETLLDIKLCATFDATPLEDGIGHPAESVIQEALLSTADRLLAAEILREFCLNPTRPVFGASILRCLGRLPEAGTSEWREQLVRDALKADNLEVRDAAIQAAESWGGNGMAAVLRKHDEPDAFLRHYQYKVADNL